MSNPPVQDGDPGHRVRPSSNEIEAIITVHRGFPEEDTQTHFQMQSVTDDAEVNAVLNVLAGESSRSARVQSADAVLECLCDGEKRICSPGSARRKRTCWVSSLTMSTKTKRRKRKLRRSSGIELEANSAAPDDVHIEIPDGVPSARFLVGQEATC